MGKRTKQIDPDRRPEEQLPLFERRKQENPFPPIYRNELGIRKILAGSRRGIGLDLEYNGSKPTILGIANDEECAAVKWDPAIAQQVIDHANRTKQLLVAYAGVGADRPVLEKALGVRLPLEMWEDSMISHYLTHMELCKAPGKTEDDDDSGALGMMNLWTAASFATDLPQWKKHDSYSCSTMTSRPCPKCNPWSYCAIDSWAGLQVHHVCQKEMVVRGTPYKLYRELMELAEMCQAMEDQGILVDMEHIGRLEEKAANRKEFLFPIVEVEGGEEGYKHFNPKSPKQIQEWFAAKGINLKSTDKKIIKGELRKLARKSGFGDIKELEKAEEELPELLDVLHRLDQYKEAGKGLKAWFDSKWIGRDGLIHPRFIVTGTSTGRLASSKPNFQNVPARGFGAEVRRAVIARPGFKLLKSDKAQLELRMCLYLAGVDLRTIAGDAFTWLVSKSGTAFTEAAARYHMSERDIAKSVSHGCLTGDHEILTKSGWKRIDRYGNEDIAVWFPDGKIRFEKPLRYHAFPVSPGYSGKNMVRLSGRGLSALATRDHTWPALVSGTDHGKYYQTWHKRCYEELPKSSRIPIAGILEDQEEVLSDLEIRQAVAVQADGYLASPHHATFHLVKERKKDRLKLLFGKELKPCSCHARGIQVGVPIHSRILSEKKTFTSAVLLMSQRQRLLFLDEILFWDGYRGRGGSRHYCNTNKESIDWVQIIVHLSGQQALIRQSTSGGFSGSKKQNYKVSLNNRKFCSVSNLSSSFEPHTGMVFCFTTTSGFFLIRHNDRVSVTGNSDYLEGIEILRPHDFDARRLDEIEKGALRVYTKKYMPELKRDWEYGGGVVAFTGANLAERLFGNKTVESRRRALEIQEDIYFKNFPMLREWQQKVLEEVERTGGVRLETGRFVRLPDITSDSPKENAKIAVAIKGQGNSAEHIISIMLTYHRMGVVPILQVHDELVSEIPTEWGPKKIKEFLQPMLVEDWRLPGFICPIKAKVGPNWLDMELVNLEAN